VTGTGFLGGVDPNARDQSKVLWNSEENIPNGPNDSATQLTVTISPADIVNPRSASVTLQNKDTRSGETKVSNSVPFTIKAAPVTVTFSPDPTAAPRSALPVPYKNLNFDANWEWEHSTPENTLNHIYLVSGLRSGTFTFANPGSRRLISMKVSANPAGNLTVTDDTGQTKSQAIPQPFGTSVNVAINWP